MLPRRYLFRSSSLPRLRSHPIHTPWRALKMRWRWRRKNEPCLRVAVVAQLEVVDEADGQIDQRVGVVFARTREGVRQIGKQGEVQVGVGVGEEAHFQFFDQLTDLLLVQQQGRDGDQRGEFARECLRRNRVWVERSL